jgi:hypothetical protein
MTPASGILPRVDSGDLVSASRVAMPLLVGIYEIFFSGDNGCFGNRDGK